MHRDCPLNALDGDPARPDAAVTARVDAAWQRIETWPAAHAPDDGWPSSVAALLEEVAAALEAGRLFAGAYRPRTTDGTLGWEPL